MEEMILLAYLFLALSPCHFFVSTLIHVLHILHVLHLSSKFFHLPLVRT
jgi:hypothetical protein